MRQCKFLAHLLSGCVVFHLTFTTAFGKHPLAAVSQLRSIAAIYVWAVFPSPLSVRNKTCCLQRRLFGRPGRCRTFLSPLGQHQMLACRTGTCSFPAVFVQFTSQQDFVQLKMECSVCTQNWPHPLNGRFDCHGLASGGSDSEVHGSYVLCRSFPLLATLLFKAGVNCFYYFHYSLAIEFCRTLPLYPLTSS